MNRDFVALETNYLVERDIRRLAKAHALKYAFRYTDDLYFNRARLALGLPLTYAFPRRSQFFSRIRMALFRRISTITLVFEKDNRYENRGFHTPGD